MRNISLVASKKCKSESLSRFSHFRAFAIREPELGMHPHYFRHDGPGKEK